MSSKIKKSTSVSASRSSSKTSTPIQETPQASTSTGIGKGRSGSPLSPTCYSRHQEKAELQNLNDRLANYIDKVRFLETENTRLTREVHTSQQTSTREVTSVKAIYENEISEARKLVDQLSHDKTKLTLENKKLHQDLNELRQNFNKKSDDLNAAERSVSLLQPRIADLTSKVNSLQADKKKLLDELKALQNEKDRIANKLKEQQKELEEEIVHRLDLENHAQTLREEMAFKDQMHQKELIETTNRRQVDISEIDGKLNAEYEEKLCQSLQEIRDQYEADLEDNKDEIKQLYEDKLKSVLQQSSRNAGTANFAIKEMQLLQQKIDSLHTKITDLEGINGHQQLRIRELEQLLEEEKGKYISEYAKMEEELSRLRESMSEHLNDYQELMNIKVALDIEIAAYRKLLESEEARLKITPAPGSAGRPRGTPRRVVHPKRKRTFLEDTEEETSSANFSVSTTCTGDIEIAEGCPEGRFIKLHNKTNKEVAIGGWQLLRKAGEGRLTSFKFHRSTKAEPDGIVTVWSSDSDQAHHPPANILMKTQKWVVGDSMTTTLANGDGEEVAVMEHIRQQISRSAKSSRYGFPRFSTNEELYHHQGDGERCAIM